MSAVPDRPKQARTAVRSTVVQTSVQHTLRYKLLRLVLVTTLVALSAAMVAIGGYMLRMDYENMVAEMSIQSELLANMTAPALAFDDPQLAQQNLGLLRLNPQIDAAGIYDAQGRLFASYARNGSVQLPPPTAQSDSVRIRDWDLVLFKRITTDRELIGTVYLSVDHRLGAKLVNFLGMGALVGACAMLIAFFLSRRLQRSLTEPILRVAGIAREVVEKRDYSRRAERMSDDEVGLLTQSFNDMLSEIESRTRALENSYQEVAREAEQRMRAQQEVLQLNAGLELRVQQRTAELETTNRELVAANRAAEKANQAKSEFLSSMSHELRTPLNAILGFTQLIASESMPLTPEKRREFTGHILKAGRHLLALINEILDLSRIESGTLSLSMESVRLADVVYECQEMIAAAAQQRGIRTLYAVDDDLHVTADRTRLKQVLLNLLSNAVKYNREQGEIQLRAAAEPDGRIRISVQDRGKGLPPDKLAQLFQPFNRLGEEMGVEEGTGIGLVVTKRLVELMHGQIGVVSDPGKGSEFWIELKTGDAGPSTGAPASQLREMADDAGSGTALRTILYIEDNPVNLRLVQEIINLRGDLRLLTAVDGHSGVELARVHLPNVILMDINLPDISGNEAARILLANPSTCAIPIIGLSANAMPRDVALSKKIGFFRYLTKPIDVTELLAAIDQALEAGAQPLPAASEASP